MKIAFVVHDYNRHGGHARYVAELASRFKWDHEVHVYASVWEETEPDKINFHKVPSWRKTALTSILSFCVPVTWMVGTGYDIIHSQGFTGFRQNIVTAHICHRAWYEAMEDKIGILPLRKKINKLFVSILEGWLFSQKNARCFIAVSNRTKRDLLKKHNISDCPVIYHGVDSKKFNPGNRDLFRKNIRQLLGFEEEEIIFLYVGDWQKAGKPLVAALANVSIGKLLIVSKSNKKRIEQDVMNAGVFGRVKIIPGSKEIEKYYALSDIFVFPSYHDSFGMVVTEAMASGLPVICSGEAGASELIKDGLNGIIVPNPWDIEILSQQMNYLAQNPNKRIEIGLCARADIEKYSWERCAWKTLEIYQKVVASC